MMRRLLPLVLLLLAAAVPVRAALPDSVLARTVEVGELAGDSLETRLERIFGRIDDFEQIAAAVDGGVVRLYGTAERAEVREKAEELVAGFEGVLYVDNDVEVTAAVGDRVSPVVERLQTLSKRTVEYLPLVGVALLVVLGFVLLAHLVTRWDAPYRVFGSHPMLRSLVRRLVRAVVILIGLLIALDLLDVGALVGALLGTAGVAGLAIGFAFKDIVENYLAGILLSLRRPFAVGDHIALEGHEGIVTRMSARELMLMTLDGNHVRIPNGTVFGAVLYNYTHNPRRRFSFDVGVGVGEDLGYVHEVGVQTLEAMPGVMDEPAPSMLVRQLGDWNVVVRFFAWVDQREADYLKTSSEAVRLVKEALDEAEVTMPEPTYRIQRDGEAGAEPRREGGRRAPETLATHQRARSADVAPDRGLDPQLREDIARSGERNFLTE